MAGITLERIRKSFGTTPVLRGVSLDIADGEFVSLLGASGCGKTTLLRIIAGLEAHDDGDITIGGRQVDDLPPKARDIAFVFQSYALYPYMTVAQNIALPLEMRRLHWLRRLPLIGGWLPGTAALRRGIATDVAAVAGSIAIGHLLERKPHALSGGQRQRVALARAMVRAPAAFLMDEPLSNLDAKLRVKARAEIVDLHRKLGTTFVYVTHDQAEALTMSDRVAVMAEGAILQCAAPRLLYTDPGTLAVARFIGTPEIATVDGEVRADGGVQVQGRSIGLALAAGSGRPETVTVGLRAEALEVTAPAVGAFTGRVVHIEHMGAELVLFLAAEGFGEGLAARVDVHAFAEVKVDERVGFTIRPGRALVFDAAGTRLPTTGRAPAASVTPRLVLREAAHG
jgi:multiple sugar transport system ATP-binding protein